MHIVYSIMRQALLGKLEHVIPEMYLLFRQVGLNSIMYTAQAQQLYTHEHERVYVHQQEVSEFGRHDEN